CRSSQVLFVRLGKCPFCVTRRTRIARTRLSRSANRPARRANAPMVRERSSVDSTIWRVVYFHYPPYAAGPNMNDYHSALVRLHVVPILEAYGVQVVLTGHEHSYQRSRPTRKSAFLTSDVATNYISSGGGGAFLYPVYDFPVVAFGKSDYHYLRAEVRGTQTIFHAIRYDGIE